MNVENHLSRIAPGTLLLEASGLGKAYDTRQGRITVLDGASIELRAGESLAIVGVSGAGKSTLLHVLGGLDQPEHGQVKILGENIYGVTSGRRSFLRATRIGFVFQSYHLLPEMDVLENVLMAAMAPGRLLPGGRPARQRALTLLDAVGLADRATHTPMELSGGEQQRVALARALMNDPPLILADEPTGNLDSKTSVEIMEVFTRLNEQGQTIVIVTHEHDIAEYAKRQIHLRDGVIERDFRNEMRRVPGREGLVPVGDIEQVAAAAGDH